MARKGNYNKINRRNEANRNNNNNNQENNKQEANRFSTPALRSESKTNV